MRPLTNAQAYAIAVATGAGSWLAVMLIRGSASFGLLPLGLIMFAALALPGAAAAFAAAARRRALS